MCHSEKMVANIYMIGKYYWTLVNLFIWGIRLSVTDLVCDDLVTYFVLTIEDRVVGFYASSSQSMDFLIILAF
jgi:hypothetical protein